ncbi:uncharacterized protein PV09_03247 [Verruconis gallopava]|uniref:Uncharacterized protein n=1 Tax=Verruconis gallopava TaxID=253628 RepID=A0A0D1XTL7_9PEZI|nr:uncharacterized protein PV09_03247 [Verruconis gallopava]KIW06076.1 hypothetical protein PV09_03247 [Verruconis gallopava]
MPRPRRTKVASEGARVVTLSEGAPTTSTSKPRRADSMAAPKNTRARAQRLKPSSQIEEIESSGQTVQKKQTKKARRPPANRKKDLLVDRYVEDDVEDEGQTSALDALKARMDAGQAGQAEALDTIVIATPHSPEARAEKRQSSSRERNTRSQSHVASTPQERHAAVNRGRTPSVQLNTDDDLYGLSPAGKASQARIRPRRSSVPRPPVSALRVQGTPGIETSMLMLQNFKRRARQPSLIRMVQQSSELGQEDEEAYLGAELDMDDTLRDFDKFLPEDESTPLNFGKKKPLIGSVGQPSDTHRHEPRTTSSKKRKRDQTEEEIQIPGSSSYGSSPPRIEGTTWARSPRSPSVPEGRIIASIEEQDPINADPLSQSDIMTAPKSSSEPATPKRQNISRDGRKSNHAKGANSQAKKLSTISTAQLQSLLPKPRGRSVARQSRLRNRYDVQSDSELDTSSEGHEDDDELSRPAGRRRPTAKKMALTKKDGNKDVGKKTAANSKQKRTYGRQRTAEKENDEGANTPSDEDEDTIEIIGDEKTAKARAVKSKKLERIRQMFAAVDNWEMEYENVDLGGDDSSPWR